MNIINSSEGMFDNKYMIGLIMVVVNLGARFIVNELDEKQKKMINSKYLRRLLIFLVIFMATRDLGISIVLTVVVILFLFEFFNENSEFSLLPKKIDDDDEENNIGEDKNQKIDRIIDDLKTL
jgi:hypothetical protein